MAPGDSRHRISTALCSAERNALLAVCLSEMWLNECAGAVFFLLSCCFPKPLRPCGLDGDVAPPLINVPLADGLSMAMPSRWKNTFQSVENLERVMEEMKKQDKLISGTSSV